MRYFICTKIVKPNSKKGKKGHPPLYLNCALAVLRGQPNQTSSWKLIKQQTPYFHKNLSLIKTENMARRKEPTVQWRVDKDKSFKSSICSGHDRELYKDNGKILLLYTPWILVHVCICYELQIKLCCAALTNYSTELKNVSIYSYIYVQLTLLQWFPNGRSEDTI